MSLHSRIFVPGVSRPPIGAPAAFKPPTQCQAQSPTAVAHQGVLPANSAEDRTPLRQLSSNAIPVKASLSTCRAPSLMCSEASMTLPLPPPLAGSIASTPRPSHPSSGSCDGSVSFCPCCGRRGRFIHEDESCTALAAHQDAFDPTRRPPTPFKLYCDAIEASLTAQKMNAKDRKVALQKGFDALSETDKSMYEAKAEAAAKELKSLKKKLSGSKTIRDGGDEATPVKRTKSSFMLFSDDKRPEVMASIKAGLAEGARLNIADVAKAIGELWKALSEADKKVYSDKAEALKNGVTGSVDANAVVDGDSPTTNDNVEEPSPAATQ
eukprot:GILI01034743.1.p1 GENE.GILI01034743.1~~GILI01034743.1.p1  ORF type:complete len:324 (+),score=57.72 GILI01034743.1:88-1059(+)